MNVSVLHHAIPAKVQARAPKASSFSRIAAPAKLARKIVVQASAAQQTRSIGEHQYVEKVPDSLLRPGEASLLISRASFLFLIMLYIMSLRFVARYCACIVFTRQDPV